MKIAKMTRMVIIKNIPLLPLVSPLIKFNLSKARQFLKFINEVGGRAHHASTNSLEVAVTDVGTYHGDTQTKVKRLKEHLTRKGSKRKSSKFNAHSALKNSAVGLSPRTEASSIESNDSTKDIDNNKAPSEAKDEHLNLGANPIFSNIIDDMLDVDNSNNDKKKNDGGRPTMNKDASHDHEDEIFSDKINNN